MAGLLNYIGKNPIKTSILSLVIEVVTGAVISYHFKNNNRIEIYLGKNYLCEINYDSLSPYNFNFNEEIRRLEPGWEKLIEEKKVRQDKEGNFEVVYNNRFIVKLICKKIGASI